MTIWLLISCLYIGGCGYLLRGANHKIISQWWAKHPDADKIPGSRIYGCLLATLGFVAWVLYHFGATIVTLELTFCYAIGLYLTVLFGWSSSFNTRNLKQAIGFFGRMLLGGVLYIPLSLLSHHSAAYGVLATIGFALGSMVIYVVANWLDRNRTDADFNFNEFIEGIWITLCAIGVISL